ncbi:MAG: hypothetical protein AB7G11_11000 [Phycisphaerales bacterium]
MTPLGSALRDCELVAAILAIPVLAGWGAECILGVRPIVGVACLATAGAMWLAAVDLGRGLGRAR